MTTTDYAPTRTSDHSERRRWIALAVVCLGQLMLILDGSIVNVALPRIEANLHIGAASLTWIPNAYLIAFGSFLLLGGRLGDLLGRTRMFYAGMSIFTLASVACGLSDSETVLDIARFIQGFGAALAAPAILALIVIEFPDPAERARTMGVYTFVSVAGGSLGLILGGVLTQLLSWHWIFFINVPIGIIALLVGWDVLPRDSGRGLGRNLDVVGSVLATVGVMLAIYAVVRTEVHGIASAGTIVPFVIGIALLITFFALEWRITDPILPPRIIRQRTLIVSCVVRAMMVVGLFTTFYLCSLYFENVRGWRPITTGLAFLPQTVIIAIFSLLITHRLVKLLGQRAVMFIGMALMAIGPLVLAIGLHANTPYAPGLLIPFALLGIGGGMCFIPLLHNGLAGVPDQDAGIASGLVNVSLQIGQAVGVALLGTIAAARTKTLQHNGLTAHTAAAGGFRLALWVLTIMVMAGLALATRYLWAARRQAPSGAPLNQRIVQTTSPSDAP
jgi:EmrB/QacA subfamily drug resistance transporter